MKKPMNFLVTAALALSVGALIGLLVAPESGRRMRKRLLRSARRINENFQDLAYNGGEVVKDVKDSIIDFTDTAGHRFEKLLRKR